jgi:hypothetical protein
MYWVVFVCGKTISVSFKTLLAMLWPQFPLQLTALRPSGRAKDNPNASCPTVTTLSHHTATCVHSSLHTLQMRGLPILSQFPTLLKALTSNAALTAHRVQCTTELAKVHN